MWILVEEGPAATGQKPEAAQMLRDRMAGNKEQYATRATRKIHGVLGIHVDDLIGSGNKKLKTELEFVVWEQAKFRFRGRELEQTADKKAIRTSMSQYVDAMEPVTIPKEVRGNLDESLSPHLRSQHR